MLALYQPRITGEATSLQHAVYYFLEVDAMALPFSMRQTNIIMTDSSQSRHGEIQLNNADFFFVQPWKLVHVLRRRHGKVVAASGEREIIFNIKREN
jgi:hypothetical protein